MACCERAEERIVALLADELVGVERAALDEHLLTCSSCWRAVQEDRAGAAALEQLRDSAPPGLADRVRLAVALSDDAARDGVAARRLADAGGLAAAEVTGPAGLGRVRPAVARSSSRRASRFGRLTPRRAVLLAAAACLLVAALVGGLAASLDGSAPPGDPPAVSAVAAMARPGPGIPARLAATHRRETLELAGRSVVVAAYRVDGVLTVVAESARPFAMPSASRVMPGSTSTAWMATRGAVGLWCLNARPGGHSMLVAARMPAMQLPGAVARLHLASL